MGSPIPSPPSILRARPFAACLFLLAVLASSRLGLAQTSAPATTVPLYLPSGIAFDAAGNLYIAETANHRVRRVTPAGLLSTFAGNGTEGFLGDGGPAIGAELDSPGGLAFDPTTGALLIADTHNHRIRRVDPGSGAILTIAGMGAPGFSGDNGPATAARLDLPLALAVSAAGDIFIADAGNHRIRKISAATHLLSTVAGDGTEGFSGDNGPATAASLDAPASIAVGANGALYLADTHNHRVRRVDAVTGTITTIAGNSAGLALPRGLTLDAAGNLYLADSANHLLRRIDAVTGALTTIAGSGTEAFSGDSSASGLATLDSPGATALSPSGLLTVADAGNGRVRQLTSAPPVSATPIVTIAGLGTTAPGTLLLSAPGVIPYGSGSVTATLTSAAGAPTSVPTSIPVTLLDTVAGTTTALAQIPLSGNTATWSLANLPAGQHLLSATFAGDTTHPPAASSAAPVTVVPLVLAAVPNLVSMPFGAPVPALTGTLSGVLPRDAGLVSANFHTTATSVSIPGAYPITLGGLAGVAAANYTASPLSTPGTLTVTKAPSLTGLLVVPVAGSAGSYTLTAHVASTTSGAPGGTVILLDGSLPMLTSAVPQTTVPSGTVVLTTANLSAGLHTFTATYTGDSNFFPSASTPATLSIGSGPVSPPDFQLTPTGLTTQTSPTGASINFTFAVQTTGTALNSPITLAATGLPTLATANFNPRYLPPGTSQGTFTLTVGIPLAPPINLANERKSQQPWNANLSPVLLLLLPLLRRRAGASGKRSSWSLLALAAVALLLTGGCGDRIRTAGGADAPQPYTIVITGTSNAPNGALIQHSATVTLNVLP